jgi:hypothetical protein
VNRRRFRPVVGDALEIRACLSGTTPDDFGPGGDLPPAEVDVVEPGDPADVPDTTPPAVAPDWTDALEPSPNLEPEPPDMVDGEPPFTPLDPTPVGPEGPL